ncbi:MAG: hypothetical protein ACYC6R_01005 [Anaerolineales bacterium]
MSLNLYEPSAVDSGTNLTVTQDNIDSLEETDHSEQNWKMVFDGKKS